MNTFSLCIALLSFIAVSECMPSYSSSDFGGGYGGGSSNSFGGGHDDHHEEHYQHNEPKPYAFGYSVKDFKKGTNFNQHETSDGHYVKGEYAVALPDGRMQIVKYNADWKNGYHADVKYVGEAHHPEIYAHHEDSGYGYGGSDEGGHGHASSSNFQSLGGGSHGSHGGSFHGY